MPISLPVDDEANELLTRSALALLIAMLLDQQMPLERAFSAPRDLGARLGHEPTAEELADYNPEELAAKFGERLALHRFPKSMAARTQELARLIVSDYGGDPAAIWTTATSGAELLQRGALPGFGQQKAKILVALLGKQLGVRPPGGGRRRAHGADGSYLSVADIVDDESLGKVRSYKLALKAAAKAKAADRPFSRRPSPDGLTGTRKAAARHRVGPGWGHDCVPSRTAFSGRRRQRVLLGAPRDPNSPQ